jgi:putative transposase
VTRKVKSDWDAWNARSLADEPIVRLILDGTAVKVRLDRKATSIALLVVIGVRADGQKVLLAVKSMGGESAAAWRRRGLRQPELLIVNGGSGLDAAIAAVWHDVPVQRCTVHKHRNLLAHAPERLHEEVTADYNDMIYAATREEVEARPPTAWRKRVIASSPSRVAAEPMEERAHHQRDRAAARRVQATHQDANRAAIGRHRCHTVLGIAGIRTDQHAQSRWLALAAKPIDQPIDLAA